MATHSPIIVSSCKNANIISIDENQNIRYIGYSYAFFVNEVCFNEKFVRKPCRIAWRRKVMALKSEYRMKQNSMTREKNYSILCCKKVNMSLM